jgi:signal transduction histidine kinase/CheY-like chemotaxis protein/Tfp pilus assembly protein PilF
MNQVITNSHLNMLKRVVLLTVITMMSHCTSTEKKTDEVDKTEYREELSAKLYKIRNEDSLLIILQQFSDEKNDVGKMVCFKNLGSLQRASSKYSDALNSHKQGLEIALKLNDTVEIVRALNNLGTDFRRIGAHSESSQHHYQALHYAETWSGLNTATGYKNRAISLNGIGSVSLIIGYYKDAEKNFREALKYDAKNENPRERAINYANLGTIFEIHQQYDSAYFYFQKSLEHSKVAKSDIGIGMSHIYLGNLYEKEQKYDLAKAEFKKAYELMESISNKWFWLQACLSIARIHLIEENISEYNRYIKMAENTASEIKSPEHLSTVYNLKHDYNLRQGNYQLALENYKQHRALQDSVKGIIEASKYMEIRLGHEQNKSSLRMQQIEANIKMEQQKKRLIAFLARAIFIVSAIIIALLCYGYHLRKRSNKILKKMERTRSDFFTNITHEFRTPLTVIQGLNRQMQQKKDLTDKEKTAFRAAIDRQSNNLLTLVNQILDVAKLKRGSEEPQWKHGNVVGFLQMAAETFHFYASEKEVALMFYSDLDVIKMDFIPSYIDKIVSNLLSNAIKHTEAGGKIDFVVTHEQRSDSFSICISDTGEGIPQKDLKYIFDFFYQSQDTKNHSGTGIGLAFTKMMVLKMNGKIEVESELGKGSVFTVTLPLKNKKAPHILPLNEDERSFSALSANHEIFAESYKETKDMDNEVSTAQPLILIVEDNRDIALYLKSLLMHKYNIITARNGKEGLEEAEICIPDLVITDLMMPLKDGYQLVSEMKQNRLLNHIPIIMITAKATDVDRIKSLSYGVEAYIQKPFQEQELLIRIENIFENRRILKERYMNTIIRSNTENKLENDANLEFLQTITSIIHSEINNPELNSSFLADKMAMSISQLSRKINGITGYSTIAYVLKLKLNKAKKMLADDSILISEVSDACGFYDASYFSRIFKKEFGVSPSHYQKMPTLTS